MFTRRYVAATLTMTLLVAAGIGLSRYTFLRQQAPSVQTPQIDVDLGDVQLRFPKGVAVDAGVVAENTPALFTLPFINLGRETVDLARFQICETCFKGARLMTSNQHAAFGESGTLAFEIMPGARAGHQAVHVEVEYAAPGPQPETAKKPRFAVQLSFTNDSQGTCHWENSILDFGDVPCDAAPSRRISLIQQLRRELTPELRLRTDVSDAVTAKIVAEAEAPSFFNLPGTAYEVEIQLQPRSGEIGPGRTFVIAETPLGDQKLEVQWNSATDYILRPSSGVFITSPNKTLTQIVTVRSVRSRPFRILSADCNIPNIQVVVNDSLNDAICQRVSLTVPARCPTTNGELTVRLREQSGDEHEEILKCKVVGLATDPTPAVME